MTPLALHDVQGAAIPVRPATRLNIDGLAFCTRFDEPPLVRFVHLIAPWPIVFGLMRSCHPMMDWR